MRTKDPLYKGKAGSRQPTLFPEKRAVSKLGGGIVQVNARALELQETRQWEGCRQASTLRSAPFWTGSRYFVFRQDERGRGRNSRELAPNFAECQFAATT